MQTRKTFEQVTRDVLSDAFLGSIVAGDIPATRFNWSIATDEVVAATTLSVEGLCADMSLVTRRQVALAHEFEPQRWQGEGHPKQQAAFTWERVLALYPKFINRSVASLVNSHYEEFAFPIHPLRWSKGQVVTAFPDDSEELVHIQLNEPVEYTGDELPDHFRKKLDLLNRTHYDYKPYILRDAVGPHMLLCVRLGCQWKDLVIASYRHPQVKNLNSTILGMILLFFLLCFGGWYCSLGFEQVWLRWAMTIVSGSFGVAGALFTALFLTRKFKPLKVN